MNLRRYLGVEGPSSRKDLLRDRTALEEAVRPGNTPLARWPGPGRHPLVLLQQAAVNLAFRETADGGLLGINGPPGTGKTTLLRDLVAGVVTERAEVMARFDDPEAAFEHSGQRLRAGNAWIHLYRVHPSLRGFEMVVASSNNRAVENVSAELPGLAAIAEDAGQLRYLPTLSDALHERGTWGAIAAVLGNAQNRARFRQAFWWDEDTALNAYLAAAAGVSRTIEATDPETGVVVHRPPRIVEIERPPRTHGDALARWRHVRKRFLDTLARSRESRAWLQERRDDLVRLPFLAGAETEAAGARDAAEQAVARTKAAWATGRVTEAEAARRRGAISERLRAHEATRPGFWARLFRTRAAREWADQKRALNTDHSDAEKRHAATAEACRRLEEEWREADQSLRDADAAWQIPLKRHNAAVKRLAEARANHGVLFADDDFFQLEHAARHRLTPWFPPDSQRLRDDSFLAAIELHRAFIDAAARPLRHNLGALMQTFVTQAMYGADRQAVLPDLWASLFLVVPLISTTFASVHRMLGKLPPESLGWLLVDEAGQALPQAAVGALLRTRRAVIVGDPAQIEPIVSLPDALGQAICRRLGVDPDVYAAPVASAQTLADATSPYASEFETRVGSRDVGVPLLVHRRCAEPMFGIANAVAYAGLMVPAKSPRPSAIRDALGPSAWIHVEARAGEDKWCQEEGIQVIRLLRQLAAAGAVPDLYIVTPFVIVADRLRHLVGESVVLDGRAGDDPRRWSRDHIGTVHTAQGREAEAVILVLGAPYPAQTGARNWAGARPNLLNVAVTRAKEALYVVGNRRLWREAGVFRDLDTRLP